MKDKKRRRSISEISIIPLAFAILFLPCIILDGCSPKIIQAATSVQHDTIRIDRVKVDSVYRRDSIYIREKGDTVYKYIERWRDRFRYLHDTTYIHRTDTLTLTETRIEEVARPLTQWQSFSIVFGRICLLLALVAAGLWAARKWLLKT